MILIIERDATLRQALELYLESLGHVVRSATDSLTAVRAFGRQFGEFRIVLIDADQTPEALRTLRGFRSLNEELGFIVTHGFGSGGSMNLSFLSGLNPHDPKGIRIRFVRKPYEPRVIQAALEDLLTR